MARKHFWLVLGLLTATAASSTAAEPGVRRFTFTEPHMGTRFKIILYAPEEATASQAAKAAFGRIKSLDDIMTDYRQTSELMQLCQKAGGDPVPVSQDLFTVLARAQEVSKTSDGAFDVTVGPLVRLWRDARKSKKLPDADKLAKAKELVGYDKVILDDKARTVQLKKAGMLLDLGGIAKGYAADQALKALKDKGITRALIAAGGDIAVSDAPPGREGWNVGIAPLDDPTSKPSKYLVLKNAAVSTSGDVEQYVVIDGKRYSHIVDPKTGLGLVGRMSVTVVAPNGLTSDPLTKIVAVLGPKRGLEIIDATEGVSAYVVRRTDQGVEMLESKRFKEVPQKEAED